MVLERAQFRITPGREEEFEQAFEQAKLLLARSHGFLDATLSRGIESPSTYLLLVEWQTLEDHTKGFRGSPAFGEWRGLIGHLFDGAPDVEHFAQVAAATRPTPAG
jgi:heme-degrading monooxygenase HmoA